MLAIARRSIATILSLVLLCLGWGLLGLAVVDYLSSEFLGAPSGSSPRRIWCGLLGMTIAGGMTFCGRNQLLKQVLPPLAAQLPGYAFVQNCLSALGRLVKRLYSLLYQTADVIFCIGIPILVLTALVGWWLIEEIYSSMLLFYIGLIAVIAIAGIYNNPVRMLSLGYFNGYWLIDDNRLSFPFEAPLLVDQTLALMLDQLGGALWPMMIIMALLFYFCYWLLTSGRFWFEERRQTADINVEILLAQSVVAKLLVSAIALLGLLAAVIFVNAMIDLINVHCFFAALAIFWMDALWRVEFDQEPALCGDCRYLLSGRWRH